VSAFFMDVSGDVWRTTGRGTGGDAVLVCDEPQDPDDRGDGEPDWPWTLDTVTEWFGPLTEVGAVLTVAEQVAMEDGMWRRAA
jgi:hypothetical protein